jgi:cytosine/adenosine deaminase-related metal-dependent hydrolase
MNTPPNTASGKTVIRGAAIVTMDDGLGELEKGDILVEGDRIVEIAPDIEMADAVEIDAQGMIAIPGFVDSHRHCWEGLLRSALPDGTLLPLTRSLCDFEPKFFYPLAPAPRAQYHPHQPPVGQFFLAKFTPAISF